MIKSAFLISVAFCLVYFGPAIFTLPAAHAQVPSKPADEVRQYDVFVKDKPVGNVSIQISQGADGITTARTDTSIEATFWLIKYRYEYHGEEKWQSDRLVQIDSRTNDDGKQYSVHAAINARSSQVEVQGKESRMCPVLAMTENYWRLPMPDAATGDFSIIEPDTGIVHAVRLQCVGPDSVTVEGCKIACNHYRLAGEAAAELWFDEQGRLVRQQTTEQGYLTEQRLARIRSGPKAPASGQATLVNYQN